MIIILKRDDLSPEFRYHLSGEVELDQFKLPPGWVEQAELIVFVEGSYMKFLKHFPEVQSQESLDVLMRYITNTGPTTNEYLRSQVKRFPRRKKKE